MKISKLQYISGNLAHIEQACIGGIDWIQLRVKDKPDEEWKLLAEGARSICTKYNAKLILNDNVNLAKLIGADGVHLGKEDMPPDAARKLLGDGFTIGATANTFEDIKQLSSLQVDYMGLGPFRFTETKKNLSPLLGLNGYVDLMARCNAENIQVPIIAIGGIQLNDVDALLECGVFGLAISSAISNSSQISVTAAAFVNKIKNEILCKQVN